MDQQEALRKFADIGKPDLATDFLYTCLTPEVREKLTLEQCATILSEDPTLHEKLKEAHRSQNLEALDNLCVHVKRIAWRFHPRLGRMNELIRSISLDGNIASIARGESEQHFWTSNSDDAQMETTVHVGSLRIPLGKPNDAVPLIILHELGSFQHSSKSREKLDRIFSSSNHTFLVNTSGTGKTKLLFEGLCLHWGFYFTCAIDASCLGSSDLPSVLNQLKWDKNWTPYLPRAPTSDSDYSSSLQANRRLVYRAVSEVLLARFLVFRIFLEDCSKQGFCLAQRQRWLELQISPMNVIPLYDLFGMIKSKITDACLSDEELDEAMLNLLDEIQNTWETSAGDFFYIAVDESNVASRKHEEAFEDEHGRYPILKEIIRSLRRRVGYFPFKFVVSGTIIPEDHFQSTVGEWDDFRWCSDTGSFDDPEEHRRYATKFLPPRFATSVSGQALLDRMWQWLRGRHRYTASFLAVLLYNDFHSPHTLLGNYVENITEYLPHDNGKYSEGEKGRYNDWYLPLGHKGLGLRSLKTVTVEMHRAATSFLSTSTGCIDCLTEDRALITEDYGYFIDPDCAQIALNEPITVTAGAMWLKKNSYFGFEKFIRIFCKRSEVFVHTTHFAHFMAFWLTSISGPPCEIPDTYRSFGSPTVIPSHCKISDAFRIIGLPAALPEVKLVTFTEMESRFEAVDVRLREDIYGKLVFMASSNEDILSWFKHERDEPFCALLSSSSNTVILAFCLQRADEQSFWVFVRISSKSTNEEDINFAQEIDDLHPTKVFHDQPDILPLLSNLPNLCLEVGDFGVLRISGSSWAENANEDNIPPERRPAGVLNIDGLDEAEKGVPYEEFMRRLSQAIVQTKRKVETALPPPVVEHSTKGKKRGRSSTVLEDSATTPSVARTRKTKSARSTRGDGSDRRAANTRRTKSLRSTNVNVTTGSDNKPGLSNDRQSTGRILRSRRSLGRINDVAPGLVSTRVTRADRVEPTASTSSSTPYNLRKR